MLLNLAQGKKMNSFLQNVNTKMDNITLSWMILQVVNMIHYLNVTAATVNLALH